MSLQGHRGIYRDMKIKPPKVEPTIFTSVTGKGLTVSLTEEQLRGIFRRFDKNQDGCLSKQEIKEAFKNLGAHVPWWRAARAMSVADENGDGVISEEEFEELLKYALKCNYKIN